MSAYDIFDLQIMDRNTGKLMQGAGGAVQVCVNGAYHKATLADPTNSYATLANPVTPTGGRIRFAVATGQAGQNQPQTVDIYGITYAGQFFVRTGVKPGDPAEVWVDTASRNQTMVIPFAVADCTPGTEFNTGFALPVGALVKPPAVVNVVTAAGQASKTVSMGLLSSESGGSATGFANGVTLTTAAAIKTTLNGASATVGGLLSVVSGSAGSTIPEGALVNQAVHVSYTITSAATLAEGYVAIPYELTAPGASPNVP